MSSAVLSATRAGPARAVAELLTRHPLTAFLVWFFTVGQAIAFVPVAARGLYGTDVPTEPFLIAATVVGLLLPTLVITWVVDGPEGLRALRRRSMHVRVPARWYALVVVGVPAVTIAVAMAVSGLPEQMTVSALTSALLAGLALHLVVVFVTVNWWEEIAWMGFVQVRLQGRHGPFRAAVITGVVFGLGHISLAFEDSLSAAVPLLALLLLVSIPFRGLQAWVYNRTGSLAVVGAVHAAANATAVGSVLGAGLLERLYPGGGHGGAVFPILAVLGLVVVSATRGRLGYRTADRPSTSSPPSPGDAVRSAPPAEGELP